MLGLSEVPREARPVFRWHLRFALLESASAGLLANAPTIAIKALGAEDWHLTVNLSLSSLGMFSALYAGMYMARRAKKPFVVVPGFASGFCWLLMGLTMSPLAFMTILGVGALFDVLSRPAITAVMRLCYSATCRGRVLGIIRRWESLVFLAVNMAGADMLDRFGGSPRLMILLQTGLAAAFSLAAYLCFNRMRVPPEPASAEGQTPAMSRSPLMEPFRIIGHDRRLRTYLIGCFLFGFGGLMYVAIIPSLLTHDFGYNYRQVALLVHVLPSLASFLCTPRLGEWFDRVNVHRGWSIVRLGWGLDPLILAAAMAVGPIAGVLPVVARLSRGAAMGGSGILWWRIGIHQIAPPGADTSRYMGVMVFLNGVMRLTAPALGALIVSHGSRTSLLLVGGAIVLLSAVHGLIHARREECHESLRSTADFERQMR